MKAIALALALLFLAGCRVDDEDRCTDDYEWHAEFQACVEPAPPVDTEPVDTGEDTDTTPLPDGMGEVCTDQPDCADYEATRCVLNPLDETLPGYCSTTGCDPAVVEDCPRSYRCCDCTAQGAEAVSCVSGPDAVRATSFGCECGE